MPKEAQTHRPAVGDRLPATTVETVTGPPVDLHMTRHASLVLVLPHPACAECRDYLRRLDASSRGFHTWDGQVLVSPDEEAAAELSRELFLQVLMDHDARVRASMEVPTDGAVILVADRFGTVYRCDWPGADHRFPSPEELVDEVSYIGMQCPECGVPDDPLRGEDAWSR